MIVGLGWPGESLEQLRESVIKAEELSQAKSKLFEVESKLIKEKINILKNGTKKQKLNLLCREYLRELEFEEKVHGGNL